MTNRPMQSISLKKIVDSRANMKAALKEEGSLSVGCGPVGLRGHILQPLDYLDPLPPDPFRCGLSASSPSSPFDMLRVLRSLRSQPDLF
jgi:hypothetical protein